MKYLKLFENFVAPEDRDLEDDLYQIASIIAEGLKINPVEELDFDVDVHYDENINLEMDLIFKNKVSNPKDVLRRAKISMAAEGYNDYSCKAITQGDKFVLKIQ